MSMRKSINIPNVDVEHWETVKQQCKERDITISEYINSIISEPEEKDAAIHKLQEELKKSKDELANALQNNGKLQQVNTEQSEKMQELQDEKRELETKYTSIQQEQSRGVFVALTPLELALINHIAAKEQERNKDKIVTPAGILKSMFVNYTIHGEMYFFPHPSRNTIRELKAKIEQQAQQ